MARTGRPKKLTLDFFCHDCNASGDTRIRTLSRKHGNDGYATYFRLLETLCREDGLKLDLNDSCLVETLAEDFRLRDAMHLYSIIQTCVECKLLDRQLWESERMIFSPDLYQKYADRLEERKQSAERMKRKREADSLQKKINQLEESMNAPAEFVHPNNSIVTPNNSITSENNSVTLLYSDSLYSDSVDLNSDNLSFDDLSFESGSEFESASVQPQQPEHPEIPTFRPAQPPPARKSQPRDPFAERCNAPGHPYPELVQQNLGHLWVGPKRTDFWEPLVNAAMQHLKRYDLPCLKGDAIRHIVNLISGQKWAKLELLEEAATNPDFGLSEEERKQRELDEIAEKLRTGNTGSLLYP